MDIDTLTAIFGWMSVINFGILMIVVFMYAVAADWVYSLTTKFFPVPRNAYDIGVYWGIQLFRLFFVFFNVVPFIALSLAASS